MIKLPGLIDPHVHVREPGQTHKEDWDTATRAALAGGVTTILAMPNTKPPVFDASTLRLALDAAGQKARCDYAQYLGAGPGNAETASSLAPGAAGLKMYLDSTFGELRLDDTPPVLELGQAVDVSALAANAPVNPGPGKMPRETPLPFREVRRTRQTRCNQRGTRTPIDNAVTIIAFDPDARRRGEPVLIPPFLHPCPIPCR